MVYNLPRSASVRAASPCVIFLLDRADLNRVLKHYPEGRFYNLLYFLLACYNIKVEILKFSLILHLLWNYVHSLPHSGVVFFLVSTSLPLQVSNGTSLAMNRVVSVIRHTCSSQLRLIVCLFVIFVKNIYSLYSVV